MTLQVASRMKSLGVIMAGVIALASLLAACGDSTAPDGGQPCVEDAECAIGEYCKDGICTRIGVCTMDSDCHEGEICEGGMCAPGSRPDGGQDGSDGEDGSDGDEVTDTGGPQPRIFLAGDVVTYQDAQGVIYEINFGNVSMGIPVSRNLIIQNAGDADLEVSVVTLTDDPDDEFSLQPEVPPALVIAPGQEETLVAEYSATDGLTDRAVARIFSNDPENGQIDVQLISEFKGDAAILVDPVALDFGDVAVAAPVTLPLTITNQGTGNAVLRIDAVEPEAAIAAAFSVSLVDAEGIDELTPPVFINKGDFITAEVTFEAPARNLYEGDLVIQSSVDVASPTLVPLRGRAGAPAIAVDPLTVDFGQVPANEWAEDRIVTISNEGVGELTVSAIDLTGSADFSLDQLPARPLVVPPDGQAQFHVRYFPAGVGNDTGIISIVHDDLSHPTVQVSVGGEAVMGNADPTAVIKVDGVDTDSILVESGTRVNLDGTDSFDNDGSITAFEWRIIQRPFPDNCNNPEANLSNTASPNPFIVPQRGGFLIIGLRVMDDLDAWSDEDTLVIQVFSRPEAEIRQGGNDTGYVEVDMDETLQFNGGFSTDCDGNVTDYAWSWVSYPAGRGSPPTIGGGDQYASVLFDFPGDYTLGLVVMDDDNPQNDSDQASFDIMVRGPKAFRITADWYDNGHEDHHVDVDLHLLRPGAVSDWSPDACCPKDGPGSESCDSSPDWGVLGSPSYQSDGWEDDGVRPAGSPGDEISFLNPGMGSYTVKVQFRCHSSADLGGQYICCDEQGFPCWIPFNFCGETCDRFADGVVTVYVTDYYNNETQLAQRPFTIDNEQVWAFDTIGVLNWPEGSFQ